MQIIVNYSYFCLVCRYLLAYQVSLTQLTSILCWAVSQTPARFAWGFLLVLQSSLQDEAVVMRA